MRHDDCKAGMNDFAMPGNRQSPLYTKPQHVQWGPGKKLMQQHPRTNYDMDGAPALQ